MLFAPIDASSFAKELLNPAEEAAVELKVSKQIDKLISGFVGIASLAMIVVRVNSTRGEVISFSDLLPTLMPAIVLLFPRYLAELDKLAESNVGLWLNLVKDGSVFIYLMIKVSEPGSEVLGQLVLLEGLFALALSQLFFAKSTAMLHRRDKLAAQAGASAE